MFRIVDDSECRRYRQDCAKVLTQASTEAPFAVKWEELMGWFLVPKLGEKMSWGMYDIPSRKCSHVYDMQVTGKAKVHGIEGVELTAREASYSDKNDVSSCRRTTDLP